MFMRNVMKDFAKGMVSCQQSHGGHLANSDGNKIQIDFNISCYIQKMNPKVQVGSNFRYIYIPLIRSVGSFDVGLSMASSHFAPSGISLIWSFA